MNDFEDDVMYCVYCYDEASDDVQKFGCCGEIHFASGKELNDREKELNKIDRQIIGASGIVYDPPMSQTEEYLLKKQREDEYKSNDY